MPNTPTRPIRNRLSVTNPFPYMRSNPRVTRRLFFTGPSAGNDEGAGPSSSSQQSKRSRRASESVDQAEEEEVEAMDVQADAPAGGSSNVTQSVAATGNGIGSVVHNELSAGGVIRFRRSRLFNSWANEYAVKVTEKENHSSVLLPLAVVPVELLMFYISPAEYERLPLSSRVQEVRVTVTPVGSKVCFSTNEAATKWTNSTQTMFGMSAYGLNKTGLSSNAKISSRSATKVMKPTGFEACDAKTHWEARLWGDPDKLEDFASTMGVMRSLPWYATWAVPGSGRLKTYYPDMSKHVDVWEYQGMIGKPINYSYKPRNGIIKQFSFIDVNRDTKNTSYKYMTGAYTDVIETNITDKGIITPGERLINVNAKACEYSSKLIECYGTIAFGQAPTATFIQPSLHVGLQSVQSNAPDDGGVAPEFVNACAIWQIDSEIIISHDNDCLYTSTASSSYGRNGQCDFIVTGSDCAPNYYDNYHTFNVLCNDVENKQ